MSLKNIIKGFSIYKKKKSVYKGDLERLSDNISVLKGFLEDP
jgi:hypothetical protein